MKPLVSRISVGCLVALSITAPVTSRAELPPEVSRFVTDDTLAIVHLKPQEVGWDDAEALLRSLNLSIPSEGYQAIEQLWQSLQDAELRDIYALAVPGDLPDGGLIVRARIRVLLPMITEQLRSSGLQVSYRDGWMTAGHETTLRRLDGATHDGAAADRFAAAFDEMDDFPVRLAVAPSDDVRRVFAEMFPPRDPVLGDHFGAHLANVRTLTAGVRLAGSQTGSLQVRTRGAESAQALAARLSFVRRRLLASGLLDSMMQDPADWVNRLELERQSDRLTLAVDEAMWSSIQASLRSPVAQLQQNALQQRLTNQLKQLGLAMHNFHDSYKSMPPSGNVVDGQPLLSWRVHLLPFTENLELYRQFHLDEPWDSEHNRQLIAQMPPIYAHPGLPDLPEGHTVFLAPQGPGLMMEGPTGRTFRDFLDGTSNTVMLVEAAAESAVVWTQPADWEVNFEAPHDGLFDDGDTVTTAGWADGSVRTIRAAATVEALRGILTIAGGEFVDDDDY